MSKLTLGGNKTKNGKNITHKDLRKAIFVMLREHENCKWRSNKINSKNFFILVEGYIWLKTVYFQSKKSRVDADIEFFEQRIAQYEKFLHIEDKICFWDKDMTLDQVAQYFCRAKSTIRKDIKNICGQKYIHYEGNILHLTAEGISYLCKNKYKKKYLQILEKYKMQLTDEYVKRGFPYDDFFGRN